MEECDLRFSEEEQERILSVVEEMLGARVGGREGDVGINGEGRS